MKIKSLFVCLRDSQILRVWDFYGLTIEFVVSLVTFASQAIAGDDLVVNERICFDQCERVLAQRFDGQFALIDGQDGLDGAEKTIEQTWVVQLLLGEKLFHSLSLFRCLKTCWTIFGYDWQFVVFGERAQVFFSYVNEWSYNSQISIP